MSSTYPVPQCVVSKEKACTTLSSVFIGCPKWAAPPCCRDHPAGWEGGPESAEAHWPGLIQLLSIPNSRISAEVSNSPECHVMLIEVVAVLLE